MRRLALFESQHHRSVGPGCAVCVCGVGHRVVPSVTVVTPLDAFGFVGSHGHSVVNRACFVKEASRRRLNVQEPSPAVQSLECAALSRRLANLRRRICSFKVKPHRSPWVIVAAIETMLQLNQRANPSIEPTSKGWPRYAVSSFFASRGQPSAAAHVTR